MDFVGPGRGGRPVDDRPADGDRRPERAGRLRGLVHGRRSRSTLASEAAREYRIGTGAWTRVQRRPVRFATDGVFRLDYRARKDGLPSAGRSLDLKVDQAAPTTTAALEGLTTGDTFTGAVRVTLSAADATSGVGATQWRLAGETAPRAYTAAFTLPAAAGEQAIEYRALDAAGNAEEWKRASFRSPEGIRPTGHAPVAGGGMVCPASRTRAVPRGGRRARGRELRRRHGAGSWRARPWPPRRRAAPARSIVPAAAADLRTWTVEATYTADAGAADHVPLIRGSATLALQPNRKQAEHYDTDAAHPYRGNRRHARRRAERRASSATGSMW